MTQPHKPKYQDGRRNNGGARAGAGRPISNRLRLILENHVMSKIIVPERRSGQIRYVKKSMLIAILDKLFEQGVLTSKGDLKSLNTYLNVTLGRPVRPGVKARYSPKPILKAMAMTRIFPK